MSLTLRKSQLILLLGGVALVGPIPTAWSQTNRDTYVESLTPAEIIAGLTANVNRIRTYKATYVVSDPNGRHLGKHSIGWERVPGSGVTNLYDKRFYTVSYDNDPDTRASEPSVSIRGAFNGEKTFLCNTREWGANKNASDGYILPFLDSQMVGLGLTLTTLSTTLQDIAPIESIVSNGTFVIEGVEVVNGHRCVALYGEYGYAETDLNAWRIDGRGSFIKLYIDPFSGFMPVKQEWYVVREVEGKRVRKLNWTYTADFKECEGGIWFPIAGSYMKGDGTRQVLTVRECSLNVDIAPEEFSITTWPPGTRVLDTVAGVSFTLPSVSE